MANEKIVNRENLKAFRQAYDTRLTNGSLVPEKSKVAENLLPVSSASGSTQTAPFINQGTATNNNDSQAEVDTGTLGQHLEKQGNAVCVNQLVPNYNFATNSGYSIDEPSYLSGSVANNKLTLTVIQNFSSGVNTNISTGISLVAGHKYLIQATIKSVVGNNKVRLKTINSTDYEDITINESETKQCFAVVEDKTPVYDRFRIVFLGPATTGQQIEISFAIIRDLTQWFNGDIPQDLLDNPSNFFRYYNGSLDYNTGTLVNSNGRYLVNGGQNVWDENFGNSGIDNRYGSVNYIQIIPNREYAILCPYLTKLNEYDSDENLIGEIIGTSLGTNLWKFKTSANAKYIKFALGSSYGATYNHDITISLYYEGEDYSQYIPYEAPKVYDTGSETLRSAGSVKDIKKPDGTITRNVGSYTFTGNESWGDFGTGSKTTSVSNLGAKSITGSVVPIAITNVSLPITNRDTIYSNGSGISINSNNIYVSDTSNLTGKTIFYELATPTTEQGTPFSENMDINDMGNMSWYSAYTDSNTNTLVSVPQGCKIFYPAWYVGFIDSLGQREDIDWSAEKVVSQEQLSVISNRIPILSSSIEDGTYTLKATKSGDTITYTWVAD